MFWEESQSNKTQNYPRTQLDIQIKSQTKRGSSKLYFLTRVK
uniref:Uncharacterized protein n=1 Tax=Setaria italica TaxID=4555 RepID=K3XTM0_SETIT